MVMRARLLVSLGALAGAFGLAGGAGCSSGSQPSAPRPVAHSLEEPDGADADDSPPCAGPPGTCPGVASTARSWRVLTRSGYPSLISARRWWGRRGADRALERPAPRGQPVRAETPGPRERRERPARRGLLERRGRPGRRAPRERRVRPVQQARWERRVRPEPRAQREPQEPRAQQEPPARPGRRGRKRLTGATGGEQAPPVRRGPGDMHQRHASLTPGHAARRAGEEGEVWTTRPPPVPPGYKTRGRQQRVCNGARGADVVRALPEASAVRRSAAEYACDSEGGWGNIGSSCAASNQACAAGACVGVCSPGATQCAAPAPGYAAVAVETCAGEGQWSPPAAPCTVGCQQGAPRRSSNAPFRPRAPLGREHPVLGNGPPPHQLGFDTAGRCSERGYSGLTEWRRLLHGDIPRAGGVLRRRLRGDIRRGGGVLGGGLHPVPVSGLTGTTSVSVGNSSSCALLATGSVECWGNLA